MALPGTFRRSGDSEPADLQALVQRLEREIAERRHAEEALGRVRSCYRSAFERSNDGIVITQGGRYVFFNRSSSDLRRRMEDLLGKDPGGLRPPDDRERLADYRGGAGPGSRLRRATSPDRPAGRDPGARRHQCYRCGYQGEEKAFLAYPPGHLGEKETRKERIRHSEEKYRLPGDHAPLVSTRLISDRGDSSASTTSCASTWATRGKSSWPLIR